MTPRVTPEGVDFLKRQLFIWPHLGSSRAAGWPGQDQNHQRNDSLSFAVEKKLDDLLSFHACSVALRRQALVFFTDTHKEN